MTRFESTLAAILTRLALFAGAWLAIAGTDPGSWIIGAPAALSALGVGLAAQPIAILLGAGV